MKRLIAMLLVCLMLVQMLPLGIHTHAEEMETVETAAVQETEAAETEAAPETAETAATEEITETAETVAEEVVVEETSVIQEAVEIKLPVDPDADRAQTIRVTMENKDGNWVMTDAVEVELPEGFDLPADGTVMPAAVGDHSYTENEPNNSESYANIVKDDYTVSGTLSSTDLLDYFTFYLSSKSELVIVAVAKYSSFMMGVYDSAENLLGADTTGEYGSSTYSYNLYGTISSGRYYLCMLDGNQSYNSYMFYITITPVSTSCSHSSYTSVVTPPTCGAQGYTTYTCKSCNYTWKGNYIDPTGEHTYDHELDDTCNECGQTRQLGIASGICGYYLSWVMFDDGRLVIYGTGDMYNYDSSASVPWYSYSEELTEVQINAGMTSLGNYAFSGCTELTTVTLPETLQKIGDRAFSGCEALTEINIPENVSSIGSYFAFGCSSLEGVWVDSNNAYYSSDSRGVLFDKNKTTLMFAPVTISGSYTIPSTVKTINESAFLFCGNLTEVTIPEGVTAIGDDAFDSCLSLKSVVLPEGLTTVGTCVFYNCASLTNVTLPDSLTTIGYGAFGDCFKLMSVVIPANVEMIDEYAFSNCERLSKITFLGDAPVIANNAFQGVTASVTYPYGNSTWTSSVMQNYGGTLTWTSVCNHVEEIIPAVIPTCTESGLTEGKKCSVCGEILVKQLVLSALGHDETVLKAVAPTCTEAGKTEGKYCARCYEVLVPQQEVPALGHKAVTDAAVAPTCEEAGKTEGSHCSRCNVVLVAQTTVPALGHVEVIDAAVAATCETAGLTEGKHCSRCQKVLVAQKEVPALGHNEVIDSEAVEPTCEETGLTKASHCGRCSAILAVQEVVPALGHVEIIDEAKAPTCVDTGLTEGKHCDRCQKVLVAQEVIPALGHTSVVDAYLAPTCEETGLTEGSHCSVCEEILVAQEEIPALGHTYEDHMCTVCGKSEFVEVISIETDKTAITAGEKANLTAVLDYPIREDTQIVWTLAEGDEAYATIETNRDTAVLTAKRLLQDATVTVSAETAEGLLEPVSMEITIKAVEADYQLFAGKSVTIKPINPATGKAYSAKQLTWSMDKGYEPFIKLANGKVTAQKVVEQARVEVVATVNATEEELRYVIDVYPAVTQAEVKNGEEVVNGKTVLMDFTSEDITLKVDTYPLDTLEKVTWTVSDKKNQYAEYATEGDTLVISNPKGKAGTVTIKATVDAGVKKNITVKVSFGSFAREVEIFEPVKTTLRGGESLTLTGRVSDPVVVSKPGVVWSTSDKNAATVSSSGKVTAKNVAHPTLVTITATSKDGQAKASIDLKIVPKNEGQLVLMHDGAFVTNATVALNFGDTRQISASVVENGQPVAVDATWTTAKDTIAHVENGLITATGVGTTKITAEYNGMKAVINIKVATLVDAMTITTKDGKNIIEEDGEELVILSSGKNVALVANIPTQGANKAVDWAITEGSEYAKIAGGKVTANKDLTKPVYITVKATAKDGSGVSATIRVKIVPLATGVQIFESGSRVRSNTTYISDLTTNAKIKLSAKVYPAKANQAVELTSSNKKIAEFIDGELVCYKTGTVTITAKALDGSNAKATFKLTVVKKITSLRLKDNLPLDKNGNLYVAGGKSLKLATMVDINPADATNKKLKWSVPANEYGIKISSSGVLTTKKVTAPVTINVMAMTQDDSGLMLSFNVTIYPA